MYKYLACVIQVKSAEKGRKKKTQAFNCLAYV